MTEISKQRLHYWGSILAGSIGSFLCGLLGFQIGEYGLFLFLFVPILIGYLPGALYSRVQRSQPISFYEMGFVSYLLVLLVVLITAIEGLICIVMMLPITLPLVGFGAYIAKSLHGTNQATQVKANLSLFLLAGMLSMADVSADDPQLRQIQSEIVIDAPIETVWEQVIAFPTIPEPSFGLFTTGIAYPTHATINGTGVGAIRRCSFSTGDFVEPITKWEAPYRLEFNVIEQPMPMTEQNPFWDVHPPHLETGFQSKKGGFLLEKLPDGRTKVTGTTYYELGLSPELYWATWSDYIVHRIHMRVLEHIALVSEGV